MRFEKYFNSGEDYFYNFLEPHEAISVTKRDEWERTIFAGTFPEERFVRVELNSAWKIGSATEQMAESPWMSPNKSLAWSIVLFRLSLSAVCALRFFYPSLLQLRVATELTFMRHDSKLEENLI